MPYHTGKGSHSKGMKKKKKNKRTKMKKKTLKTRNMLAYVMRLRHKNGGSAGFHSKKGYSRKVKHKVKYENR